MSIRWQAAQLILCRSLNKHGHVIPDRPVREFLVCGPDDVAHPVLGHVGETGDQPLDHFLQRSRFVFDLAGIHRRILSAIALSHHSWVNCPCRAVTQTRWETAASAVRRAAPPPTVGNQLNGIRWMVKTAGTRWSTVTLSHSFTSVDPSTVIRVRLAAGAFTP